jgi:hypothetical protein
MQEARLSRMTFLDVNNEPWGIDASIVFQFNQAAVNAIRATGATSQSVHPPKQTFWRLMLLRKFLG